MAEKIDFIALAQWVTVADDYRISFTAVNCGFDANIEVRGTARAPLLRLKIRRKIIVLEHIKDSSLAMYLIRQVRVFLDKTA